MKLSEKITTEKIRKALDFVPHPNIMFGVMVDTSVTEGGVIKPDSVKDKTPTIRIVAIGKNVSEQFGEFLKEGDEVYGAAGYLNYAEINGVEFIVMYPDSVMGVKKRKLQTVGEA